MKKIFILALSSVVLTSRAQEFPLAFSTWNEEYVPLTEATSASNNEIWDDPEWVVPIGFPFTYMGETFSSMLVLYPGAQMVPISMENEVALMIPYFADIMNASYDDPVSHVSYTTVGEPGARIFKMEWSNVGFFEEGAETSSFFNTTNFQVWIYETTNDLEFRFGPNTIKSPDLVHFFGYPTALLGMNVSLDGSVWEGLWSLAGDPANPSIVPITTLDKNGLTQEQLLTGEPPVGQVYHFDTGIVSISEETPAPTFQLYPTVAPQQITVTTGVDKAVVYGVYDLGGRLVLHGQLPSRGGVIETASLESGVYFLRTENLGKEITCRFIRP